MSTQLILYPQNYKGQHNSNFTATGWVSNNTESIVDGINFTSINASQSVDMAYGGGFPPNAVLDNLAPLPSNTWHRFRTTLSGTPALPVQTGNNLVLNSVHSNTSCGVYQRLGNLTVGAVYDVIINIDVDPTDTTGKVYFHNLQYPTVGPMVFTAPFSPANVGQFSTQFTAQTANDVAMIWYQNAPGLGNSKDLTITEISVSRATLTQTGVYSDLEDGQVICDLYAEEDIPLTLSIDDFKNVAEKVQSYSKDFDLPATKRNNQIFNNLFEVTRADDGLIFNPYVKTQCVLKQDGFILFEGYIRLINVKDKEGEISYNVNLYSEVIALADILKDSTFSDLDLSELNHDYEYTNIQASWDGNLQLQTPLPANTFAGSQGDTTTAVVKYPFIDWNHQFFLDANFNPEMPNLNSAFRPCIQVKYLISKIFAAAGFSWTSDFFNTSMSTGGAFDFDKLYMDFNWGNDENPTDINAWGRGAVNRDNVFPDNFAPNGSWGTALLSYENFPDEQGYDIATGVFTIPAGQDNTTFDINYGFRFLFLNFDNEANLDLRWLVTPASGTDYTIDPVTIDSTASTGTLRGSAVAYADIDNSGSVDTIDVEHGGYYDNIPTITFTHVASFSSGSGATATAVGPFPGPVTSVTVTNGGSGYDSNSTVFVSFNNIGVLGPTYDYIGNFTTVLQAGDTLQLQMKSNVTGAVMQDHRHNPNTFFSIYPYASASLINSSNVNSMVSSALLNALRGDVGQWDFLKGILTMFNLVTMIDDTNKNNILIEPYSDIFIKNTNSGNASVLTLAARSIEHDWTDKVDVSEMELKPLTDLNKNTVFKFVEDDDDYCFNVYKMATSGGLYGSKRYDPSTSTNGLPTILAGEEEIIAEPFAATVMKPLDDGFPDFIVPSIYSVDDSGASEGFDNSPRFLYDNGVRTLTSCTYTVPAQNGTPGVTNENEFLQFSHLSSVPISPLTTQDFNFESQQLISPLDMNGMPSDNLFSIYWQPYFNELYSPDTRIMTLKVNLSPADINTFKFYDTVFIKNRSFRVNKIQYKPNSLATVEFILIP